MDEAALRHRVEAIRWYHQIDLRPGLRTPGLDDPRERLRMLPLPEDLSWREVLDVGPWHGFFSFEAERRGARRVVAADSFARSGANWSTKEGFLLAREALGSRVEDADVDVMDLSPASVGEFDLVLMLGVSRDSTAYRLARAAKRLARRERVWQGRLAVHAFK